MNITIETLNEFKKLTGFDMFTYLQKCQFFLANDYPKISDYFKGKFENVSADSFKRFEIIYSETRNCLEMFFLNKENLNNVKWWLLLEQIEELDSRFLTLSNMNRWARSSIKNFGWNENPQFDYVLPQNQTLERISRDILKDDNSDDDWFDIARANNLTEDDYSSDGGNKIKLGLSRAAINFNITSVVDIIDGITVYGKDIKKHLEIQDDDIVVLGYEDTILQAAQILAGMKKGDNPDQPQMGLQRSIFVGSNQTQFNFPILNRQMSETFNSDDSLKDFKIDNIEFESDVANISYSVKTRLGEVINESTILQ